MDTYSIFREWNISREEKINSDADHYCFVRLYQTEYKKISFGKLVKTVNEYIVKPGKNDKKYTHAAINFQLNDNFVGVNFETGAKSAIKIEHLRTLGTDKDTPQDRANSKFDVFCLRLKKDEYKKLKRNLSDLKVESKFTYSFIRLLAISTDLLFDKIKSKIFSTDTESINKVSFSNITQVEKALICSTFVAYVLADVSPFYKKYFDMTDKFLKRITPNDLTYIPGIEYMFGGKWSEYNTKCKQFINQRPEFKEYFK